MAKSSIFYLLDTSAAAHHYIPDKDITPQIDLILEQQALTKAFAFIPQFCVSELFNTFAKIHFRKKESYPEEYQEQYLQDFKPLSKDEYKEVCDNFKEDMKFGKIFYNYELNRYHIFNADYIIPFEHQVNLIKTNPKTKKEEPWLLSSFDILVISMGMELTKINGPDSTYLLTCDKRMKIVTDNIREAFKSDVVRKKYGIPDHVVLPKCFYLRESQIKDYPRFPGQTRYV